MIIINISSHLKLVDDSKIALVLVVLIMGLLAGSVSAATFEEKIEVSENDPFSIDFTVEETGVIYAEVELIESRYW